MFGLRISRGGALASVLTRLPGDSGAKVREHDPGCRLASLGGWSFPWGRGLHGRVVFVSKLYLDVHILDLVFVFRLYCIWDPFIGWKVWGWITVLFSNPASSWFSMCPLNSACNLASSSLCCIISYAAESNQHPTVNFCFAIFLPSLRWQFYQMFYHCTT